MHALQNITQPLPELFDKSISVKVVEVAKKYDQPEVRSFLTPRPHQSLEGMAGSPN
jgi:hypothetical protein